MNLIVIKYCLLIGAILASTAVVAGPLNPQQMFSNPKNGELAADSIYQFGSDVFYKEITKSGNEFMQSSVEGYSRALIPTDTMEEKFNEHWGKGVNLFLSGYKGSTGAFYELASVPDMTGTKEKAAVCRKFQTSYQEMEQSLDYFESAKASATPGSSQGFSIGMVIPRIERISSEGEDAMITCMQAVIADREHNTTAFSQYLKETESHVREMRRIFPELEVVSDDFKL